MPDVDCVDLGCARLEQAVDKAACGRAYVERYLPRNVYGEFPDGPLELYPAEADVGKGIASSPRSGASSSTDLVGLRDPFAAEVNDARHDQYFCLFS